MRAIGFSSLVAVIISAVTLSACGGAKSPATTIDDPGAGDDQTPAVKPPVTSSRDAAASSGGAGGGGSAGGGEAKAGAGGTGSAPATDSGVSSARDAAAADAPSSGGDVASPVFPDGGAPTSCKWAFCEDFENPTPEGTLDPQRWEAPKGNAKVERGKALSGTGALHIPPFTGAAANFFRTRKPFPALEKGHFGRLFLWIEKAPTIPAPAGTTWHFDFQKTGGKDAKGGDIDIGVGGVMASGLTRQFYWNTFPYTVEKQGSEPNAFPLKVWQCLEWQFDSVAGKARFWSDGVEQKSIAVDGATLPNFTRVSPGWYEYHQVTTPWEVYIDDFAIDAAKIGCEH